MNQSLAKVLYVAGVTTFCTFLGCWAVLAHQENTPSSAKQTTRAHYSDEVFVRDAAEGSMAEVKLGQLAEEMVQDHQKDISEFKKGETSAQKPDVKQFAQKTLPTLQSHLELAQHMQAHVSREGMSKGKASGGSSQK